MTQLFPAPPGLSRAAFDRAVAEGLDMPYERPPPDPPSADGVRAEAQMRMQRLLGARDAAHLGVIISNAQRESARLYAIKLGVPGVASAREWTPAEGLRAAQLHGADAAIEAIRAASNAMELNPPADFAADTRWPPVG